MPWRLAIFHHYLASNMKKLFLLLTLMFAWCVVAESADVRGRVISYGLFKIPAKGESVKAPKTPTGETQVIENVPQNKPVLISSTNRIPAKIGIQFGMWYEIANVPVANGEVEVTAVVKHPTITKPDGESSIGFTVVENVSVKDQRIVSWSGYGFEYDYELAAGEWEFEIQFKGTTICKQKFTVFKK